MHVNGISCSDIGLVYPSNSSNATVFFAQNSTWVTDLDMAAAHFGFVAYFFYHKVCFKSTTKGISRFDLLSSAKI